MKILLKFVSVLIALLVLPMQFYQSWLLYNHIHASPIMWFLFWFIMPFSILAYLISGIVNVLSEES
jgi:hypothetical protein